jgi:hypothetical protein
VIQGESLAAAVVCDLGLGIRVKGELLVDDQTAGGSKSIRGVEPKNHTDCQHEDEEQSLVAEDWSKKGMAVKGLRAGRYQQIPNFCRNWIKPSKWLQTIFRHVQPDEKTR